MTSAYFLAETIQLINKKNCMTTSESKGRFFLLNESIRIMNRITAVTARTHDVKTLNDF